MDDAFLNELPLWPWNLINCVRVKDNNAVGESYCFRIWNVLIDMNTSTLALKWVGDGGKLADCLFKEQYM